MKEEINKNNDNTNTINTVVKIFHNKKTNKNARLYRDSIGWCTIDHTEYYDYIPTEKEAIEYLNKLGYELKE